MVTDLMPLKVENAIVRRRGKTLIGPVDLTVTARGCTAVIGPNGAGKTTLLRALHGLERLSEGTARWACTTDEARQRQAFVFQTPIVLRRNVRDNLVYPLRLSGTPRKESMELVGEWAERVGLSDALDQPAGDLSGGEKQKLALARAMVRSPEVLFLDEPCSSLDGRSMREFEEILRDVIGAGTHVILSTHDMGQARRLADQIIFLLHGRVHESGPAPGFFDAPSTREARAFLSGEIVE